MSIQPETNLPEPEGLQFDHAEFDDAQATARVTCAACQQPIVDHYYEINGATLCEPCRDQIEGQLRGGSGFFRLLKAMVFGSVAALAGAAVYFAVLYFLHIQAGLVSILCGFIVGKSVRKGSEDRGGWIYQILAVVLTYLAVGLAYSLDVLVTGQLDAEIAQMEAANNQGVPMDEMSKIIAKGVFFVIGIFALPVLHSISNIISVVIILFALWEAWKFTKKAQLVVTGPYRVGDAEPDVGATGLPANA